LLIVLLRIGVRIGLVIGIRIGLFASLGSLFRPIGAPLQLLLTLGAFGGFPLPFRR
jgi:hypothetical protein